MIIAFAVLLNLLSVSPAYAYSDPGSGLLILQLIGSALVGVLFYFNKIKKWILTKLGKSKHEKQ